MRVRERGNGRPDPRPLVTSRGDRRELIYRDDVDRVAHLEVIAQAMSRFDAEVLAYCLMGNHYQGDCMKESSLNVL